MNQEFSPLDGVLDVTTFDQLDEAGIERLAMFNAEVARGLVHTKDYCGRMAKLQRRFDEWQASTQLAGDFSARKRRWWQR